jgi:hypothetical protein
VARPAGNFSTIFAFTTATARQQPAGRRPALGHNALLQHSIRGKVTAHQGGPALLRRVPPDHRGDRRPTAPSTTRSARRWRRDNFASLDFNLLKDAHRQNPGNQLNSPLWVHMVAGLGSGLFLFDQYGGPVNPLDNNANRVGANGIAPAAKWDPSRRRAEPRPRGRRHRPVEVLEQPPMLHPGVGPNLRDGSADPQRPGPLGATLIQKLTDPVNGIVLDSWFDANGAAGQRAGLRAGHLKPK